MTKKTTSSYGLPPQTLPHCCLDVCFPRSLFALYGVLPETHLHDFLGYHLFSLSLLLPFVFVSFCLVHACSLSLSDTSTIYPSTHPLILLFSSVHLSLIHPLVYPSILPPTGHPMIMDILFSYTAFDTSSTAFPLVFSSLYPYAFSAPPAFIASSIPSDISHISLVCVFRFLLCPPPFALLWQHPFVSRLFLYLPSVFAFPASDSVPSRWPRQRRWRSPDASGRFKVYFVHFSSL
jgi:hypothetical protein